MEGDFLKVIYIIGYDKAQLQINELRDPTVQ